MDEMMNLLASLLTAMHHSSWISPNSWDCLQRVVRNSLGTDSIFVQSEVYFVKPLFTNQTVYVATKALPLHPNQVFSNVLIYKQMSRWVDYQIYGKVVILTESLAGIDILWEKHRILNLIVIVQESNTTCVLFSWFPYEKETCRRQISFNVVDIWEKGEFLMGNNLFPEKIPKHFEGCPLKFSTGVCPPFTLDGKNGPEDLAVRDLFQTLNLSINLLPVADDVRWYYTFFLPNGSVSGAFKFLEDGVVDVAGGCMYLINRGMSGYDFLPSHMADYLVWYFPIAVPASNGEGLYIGFRHIVWFLTITAVLLTGFICIASMPKSMWSQSVVWTSSRLLGIPYLCRHVGKVLKAYGVFFELIILVVTTLYKSTLLLNLTFPRMLGFSDPYDGIISGLILQYRQNFAHLQNQSNHEMWNMILTPERSRKVFYFDYDLISKDRKSMALALKITDRNFLQNEFPKTPFESQIYEYPIPFQKLDVTLVLRKYHPLTNVLAKKMERLISAGLPELYLRRSFYRSPTKPKGHNQSNESVKLTQLLPAFYLVLVLLSLCCVILGMEVIYSNINFNFTKDETAFISGLHRRNIIDLFRNRLRMAKKGS